MDTTLTEPEPSPWPDLPAEAREALAARFELLSEVGRGGMGVVYRARQRLLQREVALKVCLPGVSPGRFLREARLLAQLRSPHVVTVHDFDLLPGGFPVLVMEWIEGLNLAQVISERKGPVEEHQVIAWMRQTCEGMRAAAELGIVHRDLKPSNILIDRAGIAWVADFGLARSGVVADGDARTIQGSTMGTPHYMAPEQAEDPHVVDSRADIYSFGATFYHALTGVTPFSGSTAFTILFKHKTEPVIAPRSRNPSLTERIGEVIERCLAKAPDGRFPSFAELGRHLEPTSAETSPWDAPDDPALVPYLSRYHVYRRIYFGEYNLESYDLYEFPGGRALRILHGDITKERVDAIVSSDDMQLSMAGSVARAIREVGGPTVEAEAKRFAPVRLGRAVVTSAGGLPARFVFHGIALDSFEQQLAPSRDLIVEVLASCVYHADSLGVTTMALPLLATSAGRFSEGVCLDTMFRFLAKTLIRGVTSVHEARIVLFRP
jgi:serine/threonine protein kinase